ncbi:NAD(P)H-binding protein [Brachybacterium sp. UNK5269]|uniref:NmrA family NAD(P)-binding protein n=1 Tax=Brachybacterium sp. UNK5269 TaxID=3408576 RepID=UPI003BAEA7E4
MRIAVTTPGGHVGRHLTRILIRAGVKPLLLTRHPDRVDAELREHVDVVAADSWDADQVVAATRGVDAVYWVNPPSASGDPLADHARATTAIVAAARANGIRRVVFQSSIGAEKRHGAGEIDGLAATEVALDALDIDVTHLRCGYFFTNLTYEVDALRHGTVQTVLPPDAPMAWVAPRDIAEVAATTVLNPDWSGRRVQGVHGPADLSWAEVSSVLTAELGREVHVEQIGDEQMREQMLAAGMPEPMAAAMLGMSTGLRDGFVPEQARSVFSTTPTTLRSWVQEVLVGAV